MSDDGSGSIRRQLGADDMQPVPMDKREFIAASLRRAKDQDLNPPSGTAIFPEIVGRRFGITWMAQRRRRKPCPRPSLLPRQPWQTDWTLDAGRTSGCAQTLEQLLVAGKSAAEGCTMARSAARAATCRNCWPAAGHPRRRGELPSFTTAAFQHPPLQAVWRCRLRCAGDPSVP